MAPVHPGKLSVPMLKEMSQKRRTKLATAPQVIKKDINVSVALSDMSLILDLMVEYLIADG